MDHRDWIYAHTHDRTSAGREAADAAFNQLNPEFDLDVDSRDPERQRAAQAWEAYRSLGGRVDNHLRIDNTGPAWMRRLLVVHRAVDALRRGASQRAEAAFTALNPDFGVLPDDRDPQQHRFAADREQALALGTRATEGLRAHNHPDPQRRQQAVTRAVVEAELRAGGYDHPTRDAARRTAELAGLRSVPQWPVPERARGDPARSGAERPLRYRGYRLDGPIQEFHRAVDALERDSVPYAYYLKVLAGRDQPPVERARGGPER